MFIRVIFQNEVESSSHIENALIADGVAHNIDLVTTVSPQEYHLKLKQPLVSYTKINELHESLSRLGDLMGLFAEV